jgi:pimeloyl-ACP methyl ester carboxylesterase
MTAIYPSRYVTANGLRFHYVENGPQDGPPVLLLHGFPEFWYSFRYQLGALGQAGFRVFAPDLRGYNHSDKPLGVTSYSADKLLDDVLALTHAFGYKKLTLLGHDWGGVLAWATASSPAHQHIVERLIVLNAPHPAAFLHRLSPQQVRRSWYILFFQLPLIPEYVLSKKGYTNLRRRLKGSAHVPGTFTEADLDRFIEALDRPGALTAALNYYRAMRLPTSRNLLKGLVPVAAKTLLIWGERDQALGKELTYNLTRWAPNLRIEYLPDSSHWVQQEQPEQVNRLLLEFLHEREVKKA